MGTAGLNSMSEAQQGIAPRLAADIFAHAGNGCTLAVTVSCLEIYGEELQDLLCENSKTKLQIREHPGGQIAVSGLCDIHVSTQEELLDVLGKGRLPPQLQSTICPTKTRCTSIAACPVPLINSAGGA